MRHPKRQQPLETNQFNHTSFDSKKQVITLFSSFIICSTDCTECFYAVVLRHSNQSKVVFVTVQRFYSSIKITKRKIDSLKWEIEIFRKKPENKVRVNEYEIPFRIKASVYPFSSFFVIRKIIVVCVLFNIYCKISGCLGMFFVTFTPFFR